MLRPSYIKKKNYCSDRCRQSDLICACDYCGKEMMIKPSYRKLKNYCSEECKERAGYNCKCDYCGKEYKVCVLSKRESHHLYILDGVPVNDPPRGGQP